MWNLRNRQAGIEISPVCAAPRGYSPTVAVLLSVHNEASRIERKVRNFLELDYPQDRIELCVGLDGCTDDTAAVLAGIGAPNIKVIALKRSGKTEVLNQLAGSVEAEILVFTDANSLFRRDAISELVRPFSDPLVGLVSGRTVASTRSGADVAGIYYGYENRIKRWESSLGRLTGADGAIYALRRSLYHRLDPALINDLAHPSQVVLEGFRAQFEHSAVCYEAPENSLTAEFHRQSRMVTQAALVYFTFLGPLLRSGELLFAWMVTSHKLLRWLLAIPLLLVLVSSAALAEGYNVFSALLALQVVFYVSAVLGICLPPLRRFSGFRLPAYFCVVVAAYSWGMLRYLGGARIVMWKPREG